MKNYIPVLEKCSLFTGIGREDLLGVLGCLGAAVTAVGKNQTVWSEGDPAVYVGIVLEGSVQIVKEDYYGNRSIMARAAAAELFGESFACAEVAALPVSVVAAEESRIMLIDCRRITTTCSNSCGFHNQMIYNLLHVVAAKNLAFSQKIEITAQRTTREKLMAYLTSQAKLQNSSSFTIPFDRQGLADYLNVERSAMSAEISKLRKDGILECRKNSFTLL